MKLKIYSIITITSLLFFSCNKSKEIKNDLMKQNLNGNVKSITENSFFALEKFGEIIKGDSFRNTYGELTDNSYIEFNNNGYIVKSFSFLSKKNEYNVKNQLIAKQHLSEDLKKIVSTETYKYDDKGYLIESNNDYSKYKSKYLNDKNGNCIESNIYDSTGNLFYKSKTNIRFNKKGDRIEDRKSYNGYGTPSSHRIKIFDKSGNNIEECSYFDNGEILAKTISKYNENNLLIELIYGRTKIECEYRKFDTNNNWTEEVKFKNGKAIEIIERKIVYFK